MSSVNTPPDLMLAEAIPAGESVAFWILGSLAVLAALGVVFLRKPVHSAIMLAFVMTILAVFYGIQQAPFLMVVQIVVYTGAVLMLFLFVLMLVGVSSADSLLETIRGHRVLSSIILVCFLGALAIGLTRVRLGDPEGLGAGTAEAGGNVPWVALEVFHRYIIAFEATGALLIVAVMGALILAHQERKRGTSQRELSKARIRGDHPTPLPGPGTYARHNAIDTPALLPDGSVARLSVNPILAARKDQPFDAPEVDTADELPEQQSSHHRHSEGENNAGSTESTDGDDTAERGED